MSVSRTPVVAVLTLQAPMFDQTTGAMSFQWVKWFQGITQAVNAGLGTDGTALKMSFPSVGSLGGVQSSLTVSHQWVNQIDASGVPQLSQPDFSDLSGTATAAQLPFTVTSGSGAPSSTPGDGSFYFDTSASPAHGYVRLSGAWVQFS